MLSRAEIDKRLAHLKSLDRYDPDFDDRCVEALETAKRLGEWLEIVTPPMPTTLERQQVWGIAMMGVRAWLRGEGAE